ncbi:hypothetical protein FOL47_002981 [Perkinsus chesapeaki]|uniref:Uncharacterized protein n=1 Tax=Perkinsus chesapeaki TaxID=330153 RepID=A0A7J6MAF7_PERCH|nr:hypothetical protein FOL47_002981 [Perkinsus chesapeaki]
MSRSSTAVRFGLKVSELPRRVDVSIRSSSCQHIVDLITEAVNMKIQDPTFWDKIQAQGIELGSSRCKFTPTTISTAWTGVNNASFLKRYVDLNDWLDKELSKEDNLHGLSAATLLYIVKSATNDGKWDLAEAAIRRLIGKGESLTDEKLMGFAECVEKLQESKMSLSDGIMESLAALLRKRQSALNCDKMKRMLENPIFDTSVKFDDK